GRSAEAGALNLVSQRPGETWHGGASGRLGNYKNRGVQGQAGGPVGDRGRRSLPRLEAQRGGESRNPGSRPSPPRPGLLAGRGRVLVNVLPGLDLTLVGEYRHADEGPIPYLRLDQPDPFTVRFDDPGALRLDAGLGALRLDWKLPWVTVSSTTAYHSFHQD